MSAAAPALSVPRQHRRERWDKRPDTYPRSHPRAGQPFPRNTHRPRYAFNAPDLTPHPRTRLADRAAWHAAKPFQIPCPSCGAGIGHQCETNAEATALHCCPTRREAARKAELAPNADRFLELSNSQLARLMAEIEAKTTESDRPRMARTTAAYQRGILVSRYRWSHIDPKTKQPRGPRTPGDGRHRSMYRLHAYETTLDLVTRDENIATPKARTFYVLDGRAMCADEVEAWGLVQALAERMPEVWACNARSIDPDAPMKPIPGAKPKAPARPATAAEIKTISAELESWNMSHTNRQAGQLLAWCREAVPEITAEQAAEAIRAELITAEAQWRKGDNRYRPFPATFGIFQGKAWPFGERARGAAKSWASRKAQEATQARVAARIAEETAVYPIPEPDHTGTDPGPPPEFRNLRTRYS